MITCAWWRRGFGVSFFSEKQTCELLPPGLFLFSVFYEEEHRPCMKMLSRVALRLLSDRSQVTDLRTCCKLIESYG